MNGKNEAGEYGFVGEGGDCSVEIVSDVDGPGNGKQGGACDSSVSSTLQEFFQEIAELPDFCGITPVGLITRGNFALTPLHLAAIRGDLRLVQALLDAGADINSPGERGNTPLHEAVLQEHHQIVRLLLARGASTESISEDGETPEMLARLLGCSAIESLFLEKGADEPASGVFGELDVSRPNRETEGDIA